MIDEMIELFNEFFTGIEYMDDPVIAIVTKEYVEEMQNLINKYNEE